MRRSGIRIALLSSVSLGIAALTGACVSDRPISQQAAQEMICLHHHENSPEEQARCRLAPGVQHGSVPEMSASELPVRVEPRN